jgi:hypothetical protein
VAYAFIGRPVTRDITKKTDIGSFRTESSEYMLKFAAFIPELRSALTRTEQEPIFRYIINDSTLAKHLEQTGLSATTIKEYNKHKLGYGALLNSPVPLAVPGLEPAHQLRDIRPEEFAVTRKVLAYQSPITVPDSSLLDVARQHNDWRQSIAAEYERVAIDPSTGKPSMYSLLGAWGAQNCGQMIVPGERTKKYEKNRRVISAFNAVLPKHIAEIDRIVGYFHSGKPNQRRIYQSGD